MPTARQAFVPQPIVGRSAAELRAYIEGEDPVNKRPFVRIMLDGLTSTLTEEDLKDVSFDRDLPRLLDADSEENLQQLFVDNHWSDMLPIILPTEERVAAMLKGTSHAPDEIVGKLRPTMYREFWEFDVEKVAVNAVMAGARPEYLPVILALAASGMSARSSSTTSFANISVVNGPIRNEIGMNAGIGAMGPYNHANATIGRAFGLLSQNLQGGSVPNETYMGSMGNGYSYSAVYPENEENSPWDPLHVQHGRSKDESAVTVFMGGWYTLAGFGPRQYWEETFSRSLTAVDTFSEPVLFLDPLSAREFVERGFDTRQKLQEWCARNTRMTAKEYWDNQSVQTIYRPRGVAGMEPWASRLKADPDDIIEIFRPEEFSIVVLGGGTQAAWKMVSGMLRENSIQSVDKWR